MPILFAMVGATGIGKSNLSLELAEHYNAEIIGVDSRQIYKGFRIGTAQPEEACLNRVKHHLVDFLEPTESYSAGMFCSAVKNLVADNPSKSYILVGGTGLYIQSLVLGLPKIPQIPETVRKELEEAAASNGLDSLYKMAKDVDPEAMENVEANNALRIIRILEVYRATGRKFSEFKKEREGGIGELPVFWLQRNRESLYKRINERVDQMMADGWLEEARELAKTVPLDAPAWQSLGYRELLTAKNTAEIENILEEVKKKTRNYAKRQLTWFRWQLKSTEIDMDSRDPMKKIVNSL
ncbi:MAG: tRNA (adenosine(37)-N6)-dimethylallyltransferase MiaA [Fibrobacter sp.]|nr:tRNA (adenosine(37)-N6)-dimethylallyltransferase MiaA [Fibrobacter sp.]